MRRYNSKTPPYYNLNITTPIGLFYAKNDMLNDVEVNTVTFLNIIINVPPILGR